MGKILGIAICCLMVLALVSGGPGSAGAAGPVAQVRVSSMVPLVHNAFAGTQIRLHNLGRERPEGPYLTWHEANASFIRLGPLVGGAEARFTIPEYVINAGPYGFLKYYVNDITLRAVSVGWEDAAFRLILRLETAGTELKGYHTALSKSHRDNGAPDVSLDKMRIDVVLPPEHRARSVSYGLPRVLFGGNVQANGGCRFKGMDLCGDLSRLRARLKELIEGELGAALNREEARDRLADVLRTRITELMRAAGVKNFGAVTAVTVAGDFLVISYSAR